MKTILFAFCFLLNATTAFSYGSNYGFFMGKVVGMNGDEVTVETGKNSIRIQKQDIDPPTDEVKVNQMVQVKVDLNHPHYTIVGQ